jgi:hypothetical protein
MNTPKRPNFSNVYLWKSTIVSKGDIQKFEAHLQSAFNSRGQFLEEYKTSTGRGDAIFTIHREDIEKFESGMSVYGIELLKDALSARPEEYPDSRLNDYLD